MASITMKNITGKDAGTVDLDEQMFGIQPNVPVLHQVVTAQLAARRAGTQSTKTRAEVRGGGRKPFKQKGTGNARQGSIRAPHFSGGGVALGPKPRKYDQKTPKKMIKLALRSALSDRAAEGKVVVLDRWAFDAPIDQGRQGCARVARHRARAHSSWSIATTTNTIKSFLNLQEVQLIERGELNAYDILCNEWLVFTQDLLPTAPPGEPKDKLDDESIVDRAKDVAGNVAGDVAKAAEQGRVGREGVRPWPHLRCRRGEHHVRRDRVERARLERRRLGRERDKGSTVKDPRDIILAPIVSEKSYGLIEQGVYTFHVTKSASKPEIHDAVEAIWGVKVVKVNTLNRIGKKTRGAQVEPDGLQARHEAGHRHTGSGRRDPAVRELRSPWPFVHASPRAPAVASRRARTSPRSRRRRRSARSSRPPRSRVAATSTDARPPAIAVAATSASTG